MNTLRNGATYAVASPRKGRFVGRLTSHCDTWATILITEGKADAMLAYNEAGVGEKVTVRRTMTSFTEVPGEAGSPWIPTSSAS